MGYGYLVAAIAGLVALGAAGYEGYQLGGDHVRAEYAARDIKQAKEAAALAQATQEKYRAQEQAHSQAVAAIANDYEGKLTDAQRKTTMALDAIRSGAVRLRDPYAKPEACGSAAAETVASPSGRDGDTAGQLSGATSEFLVNLAAEADRNTLQLAACQSVIVSDRK